MDESAAQPTSGRVVLPLKHLLLLIAAGLLAGTFIVMAFVLPAEYGRDPLGIGELTGLNRLGSAGPVEFDAGNASAALAVAYDMPMRADAIHIPLTDFLGGASGSELEYKVAMKKGATLVYAFEVEGAGSDDDLRYDFHGHTVPRQGEAMTVVSWGDAYGNRAQGALTAPFDGIQGWQFANTGEMPVVVHLRLSGFYQLIPAGEEGNLAGIVANVPAPDARPGFRPRVLD
jgi:hypothetical protein